MAIGVLIWDSTKEISDLTLHVRGLERVRRQNMEQSVMRHKGRGQAPCKRVRGVHEATTLAPTEAPLVVGLSRSTPTTRPSCAAAGSVLDRSCYTPPNTATLQILGLAIVPTMTSVGAVLSTLL